MRKPVRSALLWVLVVAGVLLLGWWGDAHGQSSGPISTPRLNNAFYYVGTSPYTTTIQSAVTAACAAGKGQVVVPPGVTPSDSPTAVSGCAAVAIVVMSVPEACYSTGSTAYTETQCLSNASSGQFTLGNTTVMLGGTITNITGLTGVAIADPGNPGGGLIVTGASTSGMGIKKQSVAVGGFSSPYWDQVFSNAGGCPTPGCGWESFGATAAGAIGPLDIDPSGNVYLYALGASTSPLCTTTYGKITNSGCNGGGVSGSGTTGTIPIWTGSAALGNSVLTYASSTLSSSANVALNGTTNTMGASGTGQFAYNQNSTDSFFGIFNSGTGTWYGIRNQLSGPLSYGGYPVAALGAFYAGMNIGATTAYNSSSNPAFGVNASNQSGYGVGQNLLNVQLNGVVTTYNCTVDDGSGNSSCPGNVTVHGGTNVLYRCTTAGLLPVGALTTVTSNCTASTDTGLRVN